MERNAATLRSLRTGFNTIFQSALTDAVTPTWNKIAMYATSTGAEETYPWLGRIKGMTEWLGDRQIQELSKDGFKIVNREFENTVGVRGKDIDDDRIGIYRPMFQELGQSAAEFPDQLCWPLLKGGFTAKCHDGQYFFDTDHPVYDAYGKPQSVSNFQGGSGRPWFLIDNSRAVKPIIYQERKKPSLVALDDEKDDRVFFRNEYVYGVDLRANAGYGLWQLAFASREALTQTSFNDAYQMMQSQPGERGRPIRITPKLLIVAPQDRATALEVIKAERLANGATNINRDVVDVHVEPYLA